MENPYCSCKPTRVRPQTGSVDFMDSYSEDSECSWTITCRAEHTHKKDPRIAMPRPVSPPGCVSAPAV